MVDKLNQILQEMEGFKGNVSMFAILKMDSFIDKWSVILSSGWAMKDKKASFVYLRDLLAKYLTEEERSTIARLGIFEQNVELVRDLSRYRSGTKIVTETKINGNVVYEGFIIKSEVL
jgi:hypothetical protein